MASLESVRQKIAWAEQHLKTLESEVSRYLRSDMCELALESNPDTKVQLQRLIVKIPIPENIPLIVGDCVHSLRCALDYLVWQLVLAAGSNPKKANAFPICITPDTFADAIKKRHNLKGVAPDAVAEIERAQPYNTCKGEETRSTFYILQHLSNTDKHQRIPLAVARAAGWSTVVDDSGATIHGFAAPRQDGAESVISVPGTVAGQKAQIQTYLVPFIAFEEGLPTDTDIRIVLDFIRASIVKELLPRFERFF